MGRRSLVRMVVAMAAVAGCGGEEPGAPTGAGGGGGVAGEAIVADDLTWTFVPFEAALCGNGTSTGIGINPSPSSDKLLIYLQGGGVCYDHDSCLGPNPGTANFDGFGDAEFSEFSDNRGGKGIFARDDPDNPFHDYDFVFVPYCTGDVHAADKVSDGLHFVGQRNLRSYLERLVATFPAPEQVVLTGMSAGGFGAMYNFHLFDEAFAPAPALLIDDSGPFLPIAVTPKLLALATIFDLKKTIVPGCELCLDAGHPDGGLHQLIPHYAAMLPGRRCSLISSLQDNTIAGNFGLTGTELEQALGELASDTIPKNPDFRYFYLDSDKHVWLFGGAGGQRLGDVVSAGTPLSAFLRTQVEGDPAWSDVAP